MWFEDKSKFDNLNKAILQVVNSQKDEEELTKESDSNNEDSQKLSNADNDVKILKEAPKVKVKLNPEKEWSYTVSSPGKKGVTRTGKIKDDIKNMKKVDEGAKGQSKFNYQIYHNSYSGAIKHAIDHTKEVHGYDVDSDSYDREIAFGARKPSEGNTVSKKIDLHKDGKSVKKRLHIQVYGTKNKYELNKYVEDFSPFDKNREISGIEATAKSILSPTKSS